MRKIYLLVIFLCLCCFAYANNVRFLGDVKWNAMDLNEKNSILTLEFTLAWDNSWRDDYNWDAVYVCLKYKKGQPDYDIPGEVWNQVYLREVGHSVSPDFTWSLAPSSAMYSSATTKLGYPGIFIYRNRKSAGNAVVDVKLKWDIKSNTGEANATKSKLTDMDFNNGLVQISATAIEMIYVPQGAYKIGDSYSEKSFRKGYTPIPAKYDIVSDTFEIKASSSPETAMYAADRQNDNGADASSCWIPTSPACWWYIDFKKPLKIRFFGVNISRQHPNYVPTKWYLDGSNNPGSGAAWFRLWEGGPDDWIAARDAYPIEKAIRLPRTTNDPGYPSGSTYPKPGLVDAADGGRGLRYYRISVEGMRAGTPMIKSIAMSDQDVSALLDYSVLIDGPTTVIDSLKELGARDGENWGAATSGSKTLPETYPNGFKGFYAMKYEISQEQYVKFLNKLTRTQQDNLLTNVKNLSVNQYIFGDAATPTARNGIVLSMKPDEGDLPYTFANDLNADGTPSEAKDGQTVACNYMSVADMLAYADWIGLRPLSEMEYEKMCRRPYPILPSMREYAWNTDRIHSSQTIDSAGMKEEKAAEGNANFGSKLGGPLRVGSYASGAGDQESAGSSFYGALDASGNLAEIYYNANAGSNGSNGGRYFNAFTVYSHGDGYVDATTGKANVASAYWPSIFVADAFAVRGGSYEDNDEMLAVSNRSRHKGYFSKDMERRPTISFRLGRTAPENEALDVYLTLQNGRTTQNGEVCDSICQFTTTYTIYGNVPEIVDGSFTFIWYMKEQDGDWRILEGENGQNLTYVGFSNSTSHLKAYRFKRKMISATASGETSPVTIWVDQTASAGINSLRDTIDYYGHSRGGFYVSSSVSSEFTWKWINNGRVVELPATLPQGCDKDVCHVYSHYTPVKEHFKDSKGNVVYGNNIIQVDRATVGMKACVTTTELHVYIESMPPLVQESASVSCGNYMLDKRDSKVYKTVQIGDQCWMAENLNFYTPKSLCYWNNTKNCEIYGRMYSWRDANQEPENNFGLWVDGGQKRGVCPEGWHIPTNTEWTRLKDNLENLSGKKIKASKYWTYNADGESSSEQKTNAMNLIRGGNSAEFNALPGGYHSGQYLNLGKMARWWTANFLTVTNSRSVPQYYWWCWWHGWEYYWCCWRARWSVRYKTVWDVYHRDGYSAGVDHDKNEMNAVTHFQYNRDGHSSDYIYVRCIRNN